MTSRLSLTLGQFSSAGRKPENQDFHGALVPAGEALALKGAAIAIADGISTSGLGAIAAETAVKSFLTDYYCTSQAWSVGTSGERVIAATNSWMHAQNGRPLDDREREQGLICTLSALVLRSRRGYFFHVGDARIARLRDGRIETLTTPHRVSLGGGESFLARALGASRTVHIDHGQVDLEPGDLFVLSTDGVHEHVRDEQIARIVGEHGHGDGGLDQAAAAICEAALAQDSTDNLTVQLVRIDALPQGELDEIVGVEGALLPAPPLRAGMEFHGFSVIRPLHVGSRSQVHLAREIAGGRLVALKVSSTEHAADQAKLQELLLEEWVMRRLDHPNLAKAAPVEGKRRHAFAVSAYVEGQTLTQWMQDRPERSLVEVRGLVRQIGAGLQAMHRRQMLHRDLRPQNVLIDGDGTARIIDFGSVAVAGLDDLVPREYDAAFAGTLQYSAPELYRGQPATRQSDLFSLGVIAYQLLTSELPYGPRAAAAPTPRSLARLQYVPATERNPAVPAWVDAALARAVAIDPARRYQELSEFLYDLAHPNASLDAVEPRPLLQRAPLRLWQALCAVLAVALAVAVATRPAVDGNREAAQSVRPAPASGQ